MDKNWIKNAIKHKDALRKEMGVKKDDTISMTDINKKIKAFKDKEEKDGKLSKKDLKTYRRLTLAKTLKKINKNEHLITDFKSYERLYENNKR